ncbi:MAG TPA: hypothetical protein EYQ71_04190 [Candidatus Thioglobus sp.]|nr:hypothetical protein [Candidatus Thioglobus sp.]
MFNASAAFSPDVDDWPYYVDLPVDYYGEVIEEVFDLWLGHDPMALAQENVDYIQAHKFYMVCEDDDEYLFFNHSDSFSEFLEEENIFHEYLIYPGDHFTEVLNGNRFPHSLAFIENSFQVAELFDSLGDLNGDGNVTMADFNLLLDFILQTGELSESQQLLSDLDLDSTIDIIDLLMLSDLL